MFRHCGTARREEEAAEREIVTAPHRSAHGERMDTTGRFLIALNRRKGDRPARLVRDVLLSESRDRDVVLSESRERDVAISSVKASVEDKLEVTILRRLGIAIATLSPRQEEVLRRSTDEIIAIEPEWLLFPLAASEYQRGYADGARAAQVAASGGTAIEAFEETKATWGLQATGVTNCRLTGAGVRVAVLDTGLDFSHPAFLAARTAGRVFAESFVPGVPVDDLNGHGTHCAGTLCGVQTEAGPRFGVAPDIELYVGKVCDDGGRMPAGMLLAGLEWAVNASCDIVSMSLAAIVPPDSVIFEHAADAAVEEDQMLLVAATGNYSRRPHFIEPLGYPASTPRVVAVAAVDDALSVPTFSNGAAGGKPPDIAGPGVQVYSSWPMPERARRLSGTSMAVPHVAGIAALYAEKSKARGAALWAHVAGSAKPLAPAADDVGKGLVHAP